MQFNLLECGNNKKFCVSLYNFQKSESNFNESQGISNSSEL